MAILHSITVTVRVSKMADRKLLWYVLAIGGTPSSLWVLREMKTNEMNPHV